MAHLLAQTQQKLQLNYKTAITQSRKKIELYGSLATKALKKSHSPRLVGGADMWRHAERRRDLEMQNRQSHTRVVDKNWEGFLESKGSQPHIRSPSPGFQCLGDKSP